MFPVADGIGWEIVIFLIGGFLGFERSNFITFCFSSGTDIWASFLLQGLGNYLGIWGLKTSCILKMLDGLETDIFAVAVEVEDHVVIALIGSDMLGLVVVVVVTAVVGIKVSNVLDSTRGFSINLTLYCPLFAC